VVQVEHALAAATAVLTFVSSRPPPPPPHDSKISALLGTPGAGAVHVDAPIACIGLLARRAAAELPGGQALELLSAASAALGRTVAAQVALQPDAGLDDAAAACRVIVQLVDACPAAAAPLQPGGAAAWPTIAAAVIDAVYGLARGYIVPVLNGVLAVTHALHDAAPKTVAAPASAAAAAAATTTEPREAAPAAAAQTAASAVQAAEAARAAARADTAAATHPEAAQPAVAPASAAAGARQQLPCQGVAGQLARAEAAMAALLEVNPAFAHGRVPCCCHPSSAVPSAASLSRPGICDVF